MRLKGYKLEYTPSDRFTDMDTITNSKNIQKKLITQQKAVAWNEAVAAENLIGKGKKKVKKELSSIGILTENAW